MESPSESEIKKGDLVFFQNAASYYQKHLTGNAGGYNALCLEDTAGSQRFIGLGLSPAGVTYDEMQDILISQYNLPYQSMEKMSKKTQSALNLIFGRDRIAKAEAMKAAQISTDEFREQNGGKITVVCELDAKRITELAKSSFEEARTLLDSYDVRKGIRIS